MTNAQLVEQVFLSVTGGRPTDEQGVWREDISNLLPAALGFALNGKHWEERKAFFEQLRVTGITPRDYLSELYVTETFAVQTDGDKKYVDAPDYQIVSGSRGLDAVLTPSGSNVIFSSRMEDVLPLTMLEAAYKLGNKIYLHNMVCEEVLVRYLPKYNDLDNPKELPFPDEVIFKTAALLEEWFRRQAGIKDTIVQNELDVIQDTQSNR